MHRGPRILITRLSAIGDCILTLPLACALRDHIPNAFIAWAIEPAAAKLFEGHSSVDEFIVVRKGWLKSYRRVTAVRRQLRTLHFDCVLDPQSLLKSSVLGWLSGAPQRIGFSAPRGRELAPWLNKHRVDVGESHLVDATLKLLHPLGIENAGVRFDVPIRPEVEAKIDQYVSDTHLSKGYVAMNSAASCPARRWPASRYGRVARFLGERHDVPSVVTWAGPKEAELAERIVARSGGHAIMAPDTTLSELASLQHRARIMIGSDTGPLHLAVAVGTPCLGLYGPTRVGRSGPYGPHHVTVESEAPLKRLRGRERRLNDSAMRRISVDAVCEACDKLLQRQTPSRSSAA